MVGVASVECSKRSKVKEAMAEKGPPSSREIVRLNVGGEVFMTTAGTLLGCGESFFSALLSGRHENVRDSSGRLFIDRSPKYFSPLLHYLRSGILEIPPGVSRQALWGEAEFYGLESVVEQFKQFDEEKRMSEAPKKIVPFQREIGCYVDDTDLHSFVFTSDKNLTFVSGEQSFTQSLVINSHPQIPKEWKSNVTLERSFASFYSTLVEKGSYVMNSEGRGLVITLPGTSATSHRQHLATLSRDATSLCVASFCCEANSTKFMCKHNNPHHFHQFKLQKF